MVTLRCQQCKKKFRREAGAVNRARSISAPLYCGQKCAGIGRRKNKPKAQKKEEKRIYDMEYRAKNLAMIKAKKAKHYKESMTPEKREKERRYRKKTMARHVAYCQSQEYRDWKKKYDRQYRCKNEFGEFWEAASVLLDIENEVDSRVSRYEIYQQNGTLNKHLRRRREYDKIINA